MAPEAAAHVLGLLAAGPGLGSLGLGAGAADPVCGPERLLQLALSFYSISLAVCALPLPWIGHSHSHRLEVLCVRQCMPRIRSDTRSA